MKTKTMKTAPVFAVLVLSLAGLSLFTSCTPPPATYSTQKQYITPDSQEQRCQWAEKNFRIKSDALVALKAGKEYTDHQANRQKNEWNGVTGRALGNVAAGAGETEVEIARQQMIQMCEGLR